MVLHFLQFFILSFVIVFYICFSDSILCAETENTREVWQEVLNAFKNIKNPTCGKGSALVSFTGPMGDPGFRLAIMDFAFKDAMTRSDMFRTTDNGEKGQREIIWSQGLRYAAVYNPFNVNIDQKPTRGFYRKVGYDFNPDTFLHWHGNPISFQLERLMNGPGILSVKKDGNGVLNLIVNYEDPNQRHHRILSFDPTKEHRPVLIYDSIEFLKDRRKDVNDTYTIDWAKYGSIWYAKSAKIESVYWNKDINAPSIGRIEVEIREFDPNVTIDDNDFTLEGLGISKGTMIIDKINERNYKYGLQ